MLNKSGKCGHPCLVAEFKDNASSMSLLSMMLALGLSSLCVLTQSSDSATPWTVAHQTLLPMEFSRQEYWSCISYTMGSSRPRD